MFERILVPTDGSPIADLAVDIAVDLATDYGATIHALYVLEMHSPIGHYDMVVERWEEVGERAVERVERRGREAGCKVIKAFREGEVHESIIGYAEDHRIDLIVIGTRGRTGIRRLASAGSVAERVARLTAVPVLIVGGARDDYPHDGPSIDG